MVKCVPCLSKDLKDFIKRFDPSLDPLLEKVETCPKGQALNMCTVDGKKRQRSAYQQFISTCMKSKPIQGKAFGAASGYMKECAAEWRQRNAQS